MKNDLFSELTVQSDRTVILNLRGPSTIGWCQACDAEVGMVVVAPDVAEPVLRTIRRLAVLDQLHVVVSDDGDLAVCLNLHEARGASPVAEPALEDGEIGSDRVDEPL